MSAVLQTVLQVSSGNNNTTPSQVGDDQSGDNCVANISPRERRKRLIGGIVQFVITLAILTALTATGADRLWRLPLLFLFWGAATGYFQWRDKT